MSAPRNPSEVARETLLQLAQRRVTPTPDNYRKLYHEIAGTRTDDDVPSEGFLRRLSRRLPRDAAERQRTARELDQALNAGNLKAADDALGRYLDGLKAVDPPAWNELIASLLRSWEGRQQGWTIARKRESLERVLNASEPSALYNRLQGLLRGWNQAPVEAMPAPERANSASNPAWAETAVSAATDTESIKLAGFPPANGNHELIEGLRKLLLSALRDVVPSFLGGHPELADESKRLADEIAHTLEPRQLERIGSHIRRLAHRLEMITADDAEVRAGLLELLRLLLRNIDELVLDDNWLAGQIEMLRELVDAPLNPRTLDDAGRRLKDLIYKQSQLKHNLVEAQRHLRTMLAGFVDQLARFSETTGTYHDRISSCAQRISEANDIGAIGLVLDEVMRETRCVQDEAQRSRNELIATRKQAQASEERIAKLQEELDEASRMMRHDQLTGTLNRRGLEEMFETESARAQRRGTTLALALLDIDNFKKLNDTFGHKVGDEALIHLAHVVRQHLRPQDVLARYGGEEFVILLPETDKADAYTALTRLQRELTREFFMADNQKIVITFSAGVTPLGFDEPLQSALERADGAMYQAKQAGRNRVVIAELR
ncbi:GGDEF domain-containing protein [Thauera linaloolentis]|uniref:diguanylate cyclase n=1 Tax=Thauera linaloolentis (strain DSM 12138 / JCM 21573 / CCUG 41526 / CIP 105981 / IAM 15112 / NBRC 102519 / 47Lol) TaxID=1123367 RepID=N6Z664_THAL4|nr:GGDEF domain-containing protein [Thauera linaloolentis]ENO90032.1 diguanylate cyclase [Thauera linaloolentis 47Lol = DSM 12138]MCM8565315.1 GGDEF domain-containing protein [Thauera linaloolentis]